MLTMDKVYGEALKSLSPNHKSDSREGKKTTMKDISSHKTPRGVSDSH